MNWLSPCLFSHAPDPMIVVDGKVMRFECRRCGEDLGVVLAGQRYKARRQPKPRKQSSATVLKLERKKA